MERKTNKVLAIFAVLVLLLGTACSASVGVGVGGDDDSKGGDAGATTDANGAGDTTASDAGTSTDAGAVPLAKSYTWVVIHDMAKSCVSGTGPGADIDMVAVYRSAKLIGVGKVSSPDYAAGATPCKGNKHAEKDDIAACAGPLGDIEPKDISTGYLSLGGGAVALQIGECQDQAIDVHDCDGKGAVVALQAGDEIDVYEVDGWYTKTENPGTKAKYITGKCKCDSEPYQVTVANDNLGTADAAKVGEHTGTAIQKLKVPADK